MPDNNHPTPWPPAPPAEEAEIATKPLNSPAGWVSVLFVGVGIAMSLFWYQDAVERNAAKPWRPMDVKVTMELAPTCYVLALWSVLALLSGISARRSILGKIGIGVSLAALVIAALAAVRAWYVYHIRIWG